ncbi:Chromate resistance protein ChrB [Effusibacillus consociatus]|uniref:Chromate resistance protein ChrB n=1 Tax=Effusibacillus consociatus TaxID=1117041 RepID=A0ABV9Q565_9BACL
MHSWLSLCYKIPPEPSAKRVYVWRKLKRLGAILIQDAVWVLPVTPRTLEQFQWLAAEIAELGGEAFLMESRFVLPGQEEALVKQFVQQVDVAYAEILSDLEREMADLSALSKRYQQIRGQDYFQSDFGKKVREALLSAQGGMDT